MPTSFKPGGHPGCLDAVEPGWQESLASRPAEIPPFLEPQQIEECRLFAGMGAEFAPVLRDTAARIASDPALSAFAWHTYRRAYLEAQPVAFRAWPELDRPLGREGRIFYVILALASIPIMRRRHAELSIPEQIARDTADDIVEKCRRSAITRPDLPGLAPRELSWFQHHADASVFRIGRLQYRFRPFPGEIEIYRNDTSGETVALAQPGRFFDAEGFQIFRPETAPAPGVWQSRLEETEDRILGNPVSPTGHVLREEKVLPRDEWQLLVAPGDPVFDIHVPAGGGLTLERCRHSMQEAVAFHSRHFPNAPLPKAFACITWFLGPQLHEILPPGANILRFQEAAYLFPVPSRGNEGFHFIFGQDQLPEKLPENASRLLKSIHEHVRQGKPWRGGGMFVPTDEVDRFGVRG